MIKIYHLNCFNKYIFSNIQLALHLSTHLYTHTYTYAHNARAPNTHIILNNLVGLIWFGFGLKSEIEKPIELFQFGSDLPIRIGLDWLFRF